jgi:LSU ribosomal protein L5P
MATRIKEKYLAEAIPALEEKFGYKNAMQVPKLAKIVINMGLGDCKDNAKAMEMAVNELTTIAGQKPMVTKAKKTIANFKVREGMNVGAKVTLRGVPDGRVHGQAGFRGAAPRPRLPRRERQGL